MNNETKQIKQRIIKRFNEILPTREIDCFHTVNIGLFYLMPTEPNGVCRYFAYEADSARTFQRVFNIYPEIISEDYFVELTEFLFNKVVTFMDKQEAWYIMCALD